MKANQTEQNAMFSKAILGISEAVKAITANRGDATGSKQRSHVCSTPHVSLLAQGHGHAP